MKEIGGYFELELKPGVEKFHLTSYRLKSGRSSLHFIFEHVKPSRVYLPYYTCDALLEPAIEYGVPYSFYAIDKNLEIHGLPDLKDNELIVYVNYFDIKRDYVSRLSNFYADKLIVDCTQSFFLKGNDSSWFFNSCRKFFGVPDGSDLYVPAGYDLLHGYDALADNTGFLTDHLIMRFNGDTEKGYPYFKQNEVLNDSALFKMSKLSACLLSHVDFNATIQVRKRNFNYLHDRLKSTNLLDVGDANDPAPVFYPYLPAQLFEKKKFWDKKLFVPVLWTDCINRKLSDQFQWEEKISNYLLPLPVDHRYGKSDMNNLLSLISL
ncbi:MAG: hypothetical protein WKF97_10965 [Chitinophagaceae bacterium]